jgi:hypothetical protein
MAEEISKVLLNKNQRQIELVPTNEKQIEFLTEFAGFLGLDISEKIPSQKVVTLMFDPAVNWQRLRVKPPTLVITIQRN